MLNTTLLFRAALAGWLWMFLRRKLWGVRDEAAVTVTVWRRSWHFMGAALLFLWRYRRLIKRLV